MYLKIYATIALLLGLVFIIAVPSRSGIGYGWVAFHIVLLAIAIFKRQQPPKQ